MSSSLCIKRLWILALVSAGLLCGTDAAAGSSNTPVFTSGNSNQVLTVGRPYSYQLSATPTPIFTVTGLPPGLIMSSVGLIYGTPTATGSYTATITASNDSLSVQEMGMGASETVNISSSTLGNNLEVYAGAINVQFNGTTGVGFCIDPWHFSLNGAQTFNWESLSTGPKMADGMGVSTALEIEQLWDKYYSSSMSNSTAAGLQIAIWDLVNASINSQTGGSDWYTLNVENDYGASSMISYVESNPTLPAANLSAVTGAGQDYVTLTSNVPSAPLATSTQTLPFTVYALPVLTSAGSETVPVGQPFTYTIAATNSPTSYSATSLPSGLSVNTSTGVISGTPSHTGTYTIPLAASNPGGSGGGDLTLTVATAYTLTISGSPSAGGSATGAGVYAAGSVVNISETANSGYRTNGWTGSSSIASPSSASTTIVLNSSATITPSFVQQVTLAINPATGGTATGAGTYDVGTTVPIVETAGSGYRTNGWSGSSSIVSPTSASTSIVLNSSATITPAFVQRVTLAINSTAGGTATGAGTYDVGSSVQIVETAGSGYRTNGWSGSSSIVSPTSASTSIVLNSSATITPAFVQQATLAINSATGGTATGAGTYDVGTTVPIVETAGSGYRTNGWSGSSSIVSPTSASTSIVLNSSATITPAFVQRVTLAINSTAGGTATGAGTYDVGSSVQIVETAGSGYRTNGWSGSSSIVSPTSASTSIVLNSSATITPAFVQQATLAINSATGGTATGAGTYDVGTTVPIVETAGSGYRTNGWSGSSSIVSPTSASTSIVLNSSATITPAFVQQVSLAINSVAGGTATGAGTYDVGTTVPIVETAGSGYRTNGWSGSSSIVSPTSASTSIVLNSSATITPAFVQQVTLAINSVAGGTATGAGTYDVGSSVPIVESAGSGYRTNGWSGSSSIVSPTSASTSIVLNSSATITPAFVQQVSLTVISGAGGTATGSGTFDIGSTEPIAATPASGYSFADWTGASPASTSSGSTTITMTGNLTVDANFAPLPPSAVITAAATAYTGSPFNVTSTASAPADNLTLHSIEWLSPSGTWTVSSVAVSGGTSNRSLGITFPTTGTYTLRAGASDDNGTTWVYSPTTQVAVSNGITTYTLETMAVPSSASLLSWYAPSPVAQKTYEVQHVNP